METKFSIGQKVWFMFNSTPICEPICRIEVVSKPTKYDESESDNYGEVLEWATPLIYYSFWDCDDEMSNSKHENEIFATKEELRKYVFGE